MLARRKMSGIERNREIRAAACCIGGVNGSVHTPLEVRTYGGHEVSARRETKHTDPVRIDMQLRGLETHQPNRSLRVLQRGAAIAIIPGL